MHRSVAAALAGPLGLLAISACTDETPPQDEPTEATSGSTTGSADGTGTAGSTGGTTGDSDAGWTVDPDDGTTGDFPSLDEQLAEILAQQEVPVVPLEPAPAQDPALVALGEALFFDPILSGNEDIACATCHHPSFGASDGLSLTLGTGAVGLGPERVEGPHPPFVPRHSISLFNIGDPSFTRMFWDGRVELDERGQLRTPAGPDLLPGLSSALAAQAMFPVLDRLEMRGQPGDMTVRGEVNELAALDDADPQAIWSATMQRLGDIEGYVELFDAAYPGQSFETLTFVHAANAMAAYQSEAFSFPNAPWDDYLRGDLGAISDAAKFGAILFYGAAQCGECHSGPLLTDHEFHNTGIPQLGPGQSASAPFDYGRELVTGDPADRFFFRTPALRNVEVSAPYMHDGVHIDFQRVLVHYGAPLTAIEDFDPRGLLPELIDTLQQDPEHIAEIVSSLSEELNVEPNNVGLSNLREFLETLTDPEVFSLPDIRPTSVPSGLEPP